MNKDITTHSIVKDLLHVCSWYQGRDVDTCERVEAYAESLKIYTNMEENFRVIIAGGRDFNDFRMLSEVCMHMLQNKKNVEVVSGTANGADKLGEQFAKFAGHQLKQFPASWDELGKAAGFIRNKEMAEYADALIVFWDGKSKGTGHMIDLAKKMNLKMKIVMYSNEPKVEVKKEWWQ